MDYDDNELLDNISDSPEEARDALYEKYYCQFVDANNNVLYEWFDITLYEASPGNYLQRYNSTA